MKRYRYGDPSSQGFLQKARPYMLLFVGWNLAGALVWRFANSRAEKSDPKWSSRSSAERIARLEGSIPADTKTFSFSIHKSEESDNSKSDS